MPRVFPADLTTLNHIVRWYDNPDACTLEYSINFSLYATFFIHHRNSLKTSS